MTIDAQKEPFMVTFLTDSLPLSGLGHSRRCLALGCELKALGARVNFIVLAKSDVDLFTKDGFSPTCLPPGPKPLDLTQYLGYIRTSLLIVDTYLLQKSFIEEFARHSPLLPILAFDDYGEKANWPILGILNPGLGADTIPYPGRFELFSAKGPPYMPLPSECLQATLRKSVIAQRQQAFPQNILLVMGASDPERQTLRLARILSGMRETFVLHVVAGPLYGPTDELLNLCRSDARLRLYVVPTDVHSLATTCDLAIVGAGVTVSEFIYLGVPVAALILADNQEPTANALQKCGLGVNLGRFDRMDDHALTEALKTIVSMPENLEEMAFKGKQIVDGKGAARLAAHVLTTWDCYQGKGFSIQEVANEYRAAFSYTEPHEKVLWGSQEGMENRYKLALRLLGTLNGASWLDVGSGTGDFLLIASKEGQKISNYLGIDLSPELTEYAHERCRNLTGVQFDFICQDFMMFIQRGPFALVTCLGVLQKCGVGIYQAVARLAELVRPGGRLLLSTKNIAWIAFDEPAFTPYPGHHWFRPEQLRDAFSKAGLHIDRMEGYEPRAGRLLAVKDAHSIFILARKADHD